MCVHCPLTSNVQVRHMETSSPFDPVRNVPVNRSPQEGMDLYGFIITI